MDSGLLMATGVTLVMEGARVFDFNWAGTDEDLRKKRPKEMFFFFVENHQTRVLSDWSTWT